MLPSEFQQFKIHTKNNIENWKNKFKIRILKK